jgi:hypothetical protein
MRKKFLYVSVLVILVSGLAVSWSCGNLDPSQAPSDAIVEIVQAGEGAAQTESYSVDEELNVPISCRPRMLTNMEAQCVANPEGCFEDDDGDPGTDNRDDCYNKEEPLTPEEVASCCGVRRNYMTEACIDNARDRINMGDCGYKEIILTALIYRGGVTATKDTYNDMEIRWKTIGLRSTVCGQGVEMWGVNEQRCSPVTPTALAEPFMDTTDDRGMSEIKLTWPIPVYPGSTYTYGASADIGYASAEFRIEVSVDEKSDDSGTSDDDAATDDDDE